MIELLHPASRRKPGPTSETAWARISGSPLSPGRRVYAVLRFFKIAAALIAALLISSSGHAMAAGAAVVVASKIDTEGALLGNMIAEAIAARGMMVERRIQLGPTNIVRAAILAGQIDLYPEYTGNGGLFFHLEDDPVWKKASMGYAEIN